MRLSTHPDATAQGVEGFVLHLQNDELGIVAAGGSDARLNYDQNIGHDFAVELDCLRSPNFDNGMHARMLPGPVNMPERHFNPSSMPWPRPHPALIRALARAPTRARCLAR